MDKTHHIIPNWPAPANVRACITTRKGGVSLAPYSGNNMGLHVGDNTFPLRKIALHCARN